MEEEEEREGTAKVAEVGVESFFFTLSWYPAPLPQNATQPSKTPPPFSFPTFILPTMIAARTRPTVCMASAAKPAPAKVGRASEKQARGLRAGGKHGSSIDDFFFLSLTLWFFVSLFLERDGAERQAKKKSQNLPPFAREIAPLAVLGSGRVCVTARN